ncbi:unnamed protein product (macronuclear) [Paramecium tetraurelia]|uniref:Uncharacterized protein n=1 Tax=Paramecium tetraurelia TaxID=5888 RepID=A0BE88_PARTE|nr:uncharacterized protein GSPATT00027888001 [Paramecium tetraurelia]CAK56855.1 unnamed protein product [Paramecium tetraurelia]|eukprot:XP_001424253.1 hypothetical protein (macronuclear) [Paramecium tetraurelia strain d4-2]
MQDKLNYEEQDQNSKQRISTCKEALKFLFYVNDKLQQSGDLDQQEVYQKSLHKWNLMRKEEQNQQQHKIDNTKFKEQNMLKRILQEKERSQEIEVSSLNSLQKGYQQVQIIQNLLQQEIYQELKPQPIQSINNINEDRNKGINVGNEENNSVKQQKDESQVQSQKLQEELQNNEEQKPHQEGSDDEDQKKVMKWNPRMKNSKARQSKSNQKRVLSQSKKKQLLHQDLVNNVIHSYNCNNEMTIDHLKQLMESMLNETI